MKLSLKRIIRHSFLLLLLMLGVEPPFSYAASKMYCSIYTKTAVAQNAQNIKNNCGYTGPRWNSDPEHHKEWCLNASAQAAQGEDLARIGQLAKCPGVQFPTGADKRCNMYSIVSIGQNKANLSTGCELSGPTWNANYIHHYSWCLNASQELTNAQITARQRELDKCVQ
ncbi:hypothetical protein [Nitrosococcus wardiae]|uniref:Uncharacterized protein n=1 Tax=Nitrosococcus wardiae TaxID=1814290 RepID=A0A4P7BYB4_9GAMM|nr:hypothetical protein [Nitrosococcus wardiae]QBQ55163.1 hypothetical protein E3U44_12080 [Nitrosococcus wardiae]